MNYMLTKKNVYWKKMCKHKHIFLTWQLTCSSNMNGLQTIESGPIKPLGIKSNHAVGMHYHTINQVTAPDHPIHPKLGIGGSARTCMYGGLKVLIELNGTLVFPHVKDTFYRPDFRSRHKVFFPSFCHFRPRVTKSRKQVRHPYFIYNPFVYKYILFNHMLNKYIYFLPYLLV